MKVNWRGAGDTRPGHCIQKSLIQQIHTGWQAPGTQWWIRHGTCLNENSTEMHVWTQPVNSIVHRGQEQRSQVIKGSLWRKDQIHLVRSGWEDWIPREIRQSIYWGFLNKQTFCLHKSQAGIISIVDIWKTLRKAKQLLSTTFIYLADLYRTPTMCQALFWVIGI